MKKIRYRSCLPDYRNGGLEDISRDQRVRPERDQRHSTVFSIAFLLSCSILKLRPLFLILNIKLFFPSDETNVLLFFPVLTC